MYINLVGYSHVILKHKYFEIYQLNYSAVNITFKYRVLARLPHSEFTQCVFKVKPSNLSLEERMRIRKYREEEQQFLIRLNN